MVKKAKKKELLIKIICLLLSFGLWLYINNMENPVRERVISNIPVEILNPQVLSEYGLALAPNQNVTINLTISGPAAQVYKIDKSQFRVVADLVSYGLKAGENNIPVMILNSPSGVSIKNNYPTVQINLENVGQKTMPLSSEINVKNTSGTYVKNVKLSPLSATVEGAESLINEVSKLVVKGQVDNINQSTVLNLPIVPVNSKGQEIKGLTIVPTDASVGINIEQGTPVAVTVPTTGELPSNLTIKSITPSISSIDLAGEGSNQVKSVTTTAIDLSKISGNATIPVTINIPTGMVNISGKNTVDVNVVVESNAITKTVSVPISMVGQKDGLTYDLSQSEAKITLTGDASVINTIDLSTAVCQADVSGLTATGNVPLKLEGVNLDGVTVGIEPASVQVAVNGQTQTPPVNPDTTTKPTPSPTPTPTPTPEPDQQTKPKQDSSQTKKSTTTSSASKSTQTTQTKTL